jgi:transcriptional regulator with XRE-family HTH domain
MRPPDTGEIPAFTLGQRLKQAREDFAHLSQQELATQLGISRYTISNHENDITVPDRGRLIAWATICGVDYAWLAGEDADPRTQRGGSTRRLVPIPHKMAAWQAVSGSAAAFAAIAAAGGAT